MKLFMANKTATKMTSKLLLGASTKVIETLWNLKISFEAGGAGIEEKETEEKKEIKAILDEQCIILMVLS